MSTHNGHRQRLIDRYKREGLDGFTEHQVLELLLFYCIPRKDTNETAHNLLSHFGSLAHVLDAPVRALEAVDGIGPRSAQFLSMIKDVTRYYQVNRLQDAACLLNLEDCANYMKPYFEGRTQETVYMLCLDGKCMVKGCYLVGEGGINATHVSIRDIVDMAIKTEAVSVTLAHNHPSGLAIPSQEDVNTTRQIVQALRLIDVELSDHLIFANGEYTSMKLTRNYKTTVFDAFY